MLKVAIVIGNPKPNSRTRRIAEMLADEVLAGTEATRQVIELSQYADEMFRWPSQTMVDLNRIVAESDLAVVASPTYKATFTGLLKAFLDRYPANGLKNVTAIPIMTGADLGHSMAPNANLVPLLLELGAIVPGPGLYFVTAQMDRVEELVAMRAEQIVCTLKTMAPLVNAVSSASRAGKTTAGL